MILLFFCFVAFTRSSFCSAIGSSSPCLTRFLSLGLMTHAKSQLYDICNNGLRNIFF
jgi:hypothetical protein